MGFISLESVSCDLALVWRLFAGILRSVALFLWRFYFFLHFFGIFALVFCAWWCEAVVLCFRPDGTRRLFIALHLELPLY